VCLPAECQNLRVDFDEQCDDGNDVSGDSCSSDCRSNEICGNGVVDAVMGEVCDDANRRAHDGCSNACSLETPAWERLDATPGARYGVTMTYDADRDRVLMFGGYTTSPSTNDLDDLWEWNGEWWHRIVPAIAPQPRTYAAMTFDAARHEVVLFSGVKLTTSTPDGFDPFPYDDTWIWNGATWRNVVVASPPGRTLHTLVYDAARKRAVLYGGKKRGTLANTPKPFGDTWEWDGTAWSEVCSVCAPGGRQGHAMAYDPGRGVIVMFGGNYDGTLLDDTWELAGGTWTKITPATTTPLARSGARLAFDPVTHEILLSGGFDGAKTLDDAYSWNGQDWTLRGSGMKAGAAWESGASVDPVRGEIVGYGGRSDSSPIGTDVTERWTAGAWATVTFGILPQSSEAAAAYDPARGRAVFMFENFDTAWETDGQFWSESAAIKGFALRGGFMMAYDAARREAILFGGRGVDDFGDTWAWANGAWTLHSTVGPARSNAGMAFDGTHVVLFGGQIGSQQDLLDDTWSWDGTTWTQITTTTQPSPRAQPAVAYDPGRGRVVLFGGRDAVQGARNDLWEWNGSAWTEVLTTNRPQPRLGASLAWDPARRRLVLFGGRTSSAFDLDDTWELDGSTWTQLPLGLHPFAQHHHAMAFTPNGMVIAGDTFTTWRLRWQSILPDEACGAQVDLDNDGAIGCADEDCWATCTPECPPASSCDPGAARCGDSVCSAVEDCRSCAADCGACDACGDVRCDGTEAVATCPGDCTP
jgi:cysteine-rich repeat protein